MDRRRDSNIRALPFALLDLADCGELVARE
jgi:hypothetical protein